jgi:hypothetical protein
MHTLENDEGVQIHSHDIHTVMLAIARTVDEGMMRCWDWIYMTEGLSIMDTSFVLSSDMTFPANAYCACGAQNFC